MDAMNTAVKERPIIFSGPMVRAIIEGRKTQTRRVLGIQPPDVLTHRPPWCNKSTRIINGKRCWFFLAERDPNRGGVFYCKYGEVGDMLWVRETFWVYPGVISSRLLREGADTWPKVIYDIDGDNSWCIEHCWVRRPSIFMRRKHSRITLEITDVRVQRLQEISERDAEAEGVMPLPIDVQPGHAFRECFADTWDAINGKRHPWASNPWVWAITFEVVR